MSGADGPIDVARLKAVAWLADVPDEELRAVASFALEREIDAGAHLIRAGEYAYDLFVVEAGRAVVRRGPDEVATLGPGDVVGEMGVVRDELRSADVIALTPLRVIVVSSWDAKRLLQTPTVRGVLGARLDGDQAGVPGVPGSAGSEGSLSSENDASNQATS